MVAVLPCYLVRIHVVYLAIVIFRTMLVNVRDKVKEFLKLLSLRNCPPSFAGTL